MIATQSAAQPSFGLLPEPPRNTASFLTSCIINGIILALLIVLGTVAHQEIQLHKMESTEIVFPTTPPPVIKVKMPPQPKIPAPPKPQIAKLEAPKIFKPQVEPKPEIKPLPMQEKVALPMVAAKPQVVLTPQPKAALAMAAAPALTPQQHPSVEAVHLGDMNGVKPNANASRPATIAALGNPYGGSQGPSAAPRGVVGSTGFGNGTRAGSSGSGGGAYGGQGKVAAAGIPGMTAGTSSAAAVPEQPKTTPPVLLSHAQPEYTSEARQLKIQGEVVLRVTITATGQMLVHSVIRGLGYGLDDAAMRSASTYKFQPATRDGHPVEYTTNIIIKFQTA